jgi:hypothetical protein
LAVEGYAEINSSILQATFQKISAQHGNSAIWNNIAVVRPPHKSVKNQGQRLETTKECDTENAQRETKMRPRGLFPYW